MRPLGSIPFTAFSTTRSGSLCTGACNSPELCFPRVTSLGSREANHWVPKASALVQRMQLSGVSMCRCLLRLLK